MPLRQIFGSYSFIGLVLVLIVLGIANLSTFKSDSSREADGFPVFVDTRQLFDRSLDEGEIAYFDEEFDRAVYWYERALVLAVTRHERARVHFLLGLSHRARGDARLAIKHFSSALIFLHSQSPDRHVILALLAQFQNDPQTAFVEFESALALDPLNYYANAALGDFFRGDGVGRVWDYHRALEYHLAALQSAPDRQSAYKEVAFDLLALGEYDRARTYFESALALDETDAESRFLVGMVRLLRFDNIDAAIAELRQASLQNSEYRAIFERIVIFNS